MSNAVMLQDWITITGGGTASPNNVIIQNEANWLDVSGYQDVCVYFQLGANSNASATVVSIQTSPTKDEAFFAAKIGSTAALATFSTTSGTTPGVQTLVASRWATEANQPLSKYLRWLATFPTGSAATLTFRIWLTLNQAGY